MKVVDELAHIRFMGFLAAKAPRLNLGLSQRLDLTGYEHDLFDAEAGINGLQPLVEELGEMGLVTGT